MSGRPAWDLEADPEKSKRMDEMERARVAANKREAARRRAFLKAHPVDERPRCESCLRTLTLARYGKDATEGGGKWGSYGDGLFCSLTCGWRWACAHFESHRSAMIALMAKEDRELERLGATTTMARDKVRGERLGKFLKERRAELDGGAS